MLINQLYLCFEKGMIGRCIEEIEKIHLNWLRRMLEKIFESKKIYAFVGNFKKTYLYTIVISEELNKNFINKLTLNLKPF